MTDFALAGSNPAPRGGAMSQDAIRPSALNDAIVLVANVAQEYTIPADADVIAFSRTTDFYARWDGSTAVIPTAAVTDGTAPELNPEVRWVIGYSGAPATVSLISPAACTITISRYQIRDAAGN